MWLLSLRASPLDWKYKTMRCITSVATEHALAQLQSFIYREYTKTRCAREDLPLLKRRGWRWWWCILQAMNSFAPEKKLFLSEEGSKYETWRNWVAVNTSSCMFLIIKIVGSFFRNIIRNTTKLRVHHHSGTILQFEELDAPPSPPPRAYTQQILRWNGYPSFSLMFDPWVKEWRKPDKLCTLLKGLAYNQDSAFYAALNIHDELTLHRFPEQQHSHRQGAASP